jgi:hypothetical protein
MQPQHLELQIRFTPIIPNDGQFIADDLEIVRRESHPEIIPQRIVSVKDARDSVFLNLLELEQELSRRPIWISGKSPPRREV